MVSRYQSVQRTARLRALGNAPLPRYPIHPSVTRREAEPMPWQGPGLSADSDDRPFDRCACRSHVGRRDDVLGLPNYGPRLKINLVSAAFRVYLFGVDEQPILQFASGRTACARARVLHGVEKLTRLFG